MHFEKTELNDAYIIDIDGDSRISYTYHNSEFPRFSCIDHILCTTNVQKNCAFNNSRINFSCD